MSVILIDRRSAALLAREVAEVVERAGGKAEIVQFDVANGEAAEKAITEVAKRLGIVAEGERPQGSGPVLVKG